MTYRPTHWQTNTLCLLLLCVSTPVLVLDNGCLYQLYSFRAACACQILLNRFLHILPQEAWLETPSFVGCQIASDGRQVLALPTDLAVTHCQVQQAVRQGGTGQGGVAGTCSYLFNCVGYHVLPSAESFSRLNKQIILWVVGVKITQFYTKYKIKKIQDSEFIENFQNYVHL